MKKLLARAFVLWLPLAVATSGFFLFSYWAVQQEYRISANDPQVQIAEDGAAALTDGVPAATLVRDSGLVDIRASLAPWIAIYDASGTPLTGTAALDEAAAQLPLGVFDENAWHTYAEQGFPLSIPTHEDRFTWQPRSDVRQAVVLVHVNSPSFIGYVASGRNMREVESREATLTEGAAFLWGMSELGSLATIVILLALGWL
jgi:hypothetical protein